MGDEPAFRGFALKETLGLVERLPPDQSRAVQERIPDVVKMVRAATSLTWIPLSAHISMCEAVLAVLGVEATHAFNVRQSRETTDSPLIAGIRRVGQKVAGLTPKHGFQTLTVMFPIISRDLGSWRVDTTESERAVDLVWSEVPPAALVSNAFLDRTSDGMVGIFGRFNVKGTIAKRVNASGRTVTFHAEWTDRVTLEKVGHASA